MAANGQELKDWAAAWQAGQAAADAHVAGGGADPGLEDASGTAADEPGGPGDAADDAAAVTSTEGDAATDEKTKRDAKGKFVKQKAEPEESDGDEGGTDEGGGETDPTPAAASGRNAEVQKLHELAKKLGLKVEAGGVTTEERANWRAEKRKAKEKQDERELQFAQRMRAAYSDLEPLAKAKELAASGDFDGALKAVTGHDLAGLNELYAEKLRNPMARELQELKRQQKERDEREKREREQWQTQQAEQRQREAQQRYISELGGQLKAAEDPQVKALAGSIDSFSQLVFHEQQKHFDGEETITTERAADIVRDALYEDYLTLHKVFGDRDASNPEGSTDESSAGAGRGSATPAKDGGKKKPPKTLPQRRAAEASPPGRAQSEQEWMREHTALLRQASSD